MKQVLLKTLVGALAFSSFAAFVALIFFTYHYLESTVGPAVGFLFLASPIWTPIAYLAGDSILSYYGKNKDKILEFIRRKK